MFASLVIFLYQMADLCCSYVMKPNTHCLPDFTTLRDIYGHILSWHNISINLSVWSQVFIEWSGIMSEQSDSWLGIC